MKEKRGAIEIAVVLAAFAVFSVLWVVFSDSGITGAASFGGPADCGSRIYNSSNLTANITGCPGDGLIINASNIELDCQGYAIGGVFSGNYRGIVNNWYDNVTIKNCEIYGFEFGIFYGSVSEGLIYNNTIRNNTNTNNADGIKLSYTNNTRVEKNYVYWNTYNGIELDHANYNEIIDNSASNQTERSISAGIYLTNSDYNNVSSNIARFNNYSGIVLENSDYNNITLNNATDNYQYGVVLYDSDNNTILQNNVLDQSTASGVYIYSQSDENSVDDNLIDNNGGNGIEFNTNARKNAVKNNNITNNGLYGIYISNSSNNSIYNNYFDNPGFLGDDNAQDDSFNFWNTSYTCAGTSKIGLDCSGGNYWSDYNGQDNDLDGIGDTSLPYTSSITNGGDYLPLQFPSCPFNLNHSYSMAGDLLAGPGGCINITADNVLLNCSGHYIKGIDLNTGVRIWDYNNATLFDCNVTNFATGVEFNNSNSSAIMKSVVAYNPSGGGPTTDLHLYHSRNFSIADSRIGTYDFIESGFSVEEPSYGKLEFYSESINASNTSLVGFVSSVIDINNNSVFVNSSKDPDLNKSAELSFYGIGDANPQPLVDFEDDGSFDVCPANVCTEISYSGGVFAYNVTHFTIYSSNETPTALQPNLTVAKTDDPDPVNNGTELNYTIIINNTGTGNATNVTLYETYPSNVVFVSSSPPANVSNSTWYLGNLTNGSTITVNITVLVNVTIDNTTLTNRINITYLNTSNAQFNSTAEENTTALLTVAPNITIIKTDSTDPAERNDIFIYQITVNNTGSTTAVNVVLNETYPSEFSFVNASPSANVSNSTWYLGNLTGGQSVTINITMQVSSGASAGTKNNLVNVSYLDKASNPYSSSGTESTTVNVPSPPSPGGGGGGGRSYECSDNQDNDNDGLIDYPDDPGCDSRYDDNETDIACRQNWICSQWSPCTDRGQTRNCYDVNSCEEKLEAGEVERVVQVAKPAEARTCTVPASCDDSIKNQGEEGVDCGGPCMPCPAPPECVETSDCPEGSSCVDNECVEIPVREAGFPWLGWMLAVLIVVVFAVLSIGTGLRLWSIELGKKIDKLIAESKMMIEGKNIRGLHENYKKIVELYRKLRHREKEIYYRKISELHNQIKNMKFRDLPGRF